MYYLKHCHKFVWNKATAQGVSQVANIAKYTSLKFNVLSTHLLDKQMNFFDKNININFLIEQTNGFLW